MRTTVLRNMQYLNCSGIFHAQRGVSTEISVDAEVEAMIISLGLEEVEWYPVNKWFRCEKPDLDIEINHNSIAIRTKGKCWAYGNIDDAMEILTEWKKKSS